MELPIWRRILIFSVICLPANHNEQFFFGFQLINQAFKDGADKTTKEALTRVIVSRSEFDMTEIKQVYHQQYGAELEDVIAKNTHGSYRDALLSLVSGKEWKMASPDHISMPLLASLLFLLVIVSWVPFRSILALVIWIDAVVSV